MYCLLISTITIFIQLVISQGLRSITSHVLGHGLLKQLILELVAAAELCGTCFELVIITDNYGIIAYSVYLFLLTIWWSKSWQGATACPYNLLEEYVEENTKLSHVLLKIGAQIIGGIASFRWVKQIWLLELADSHHGRGVEDCTADLQVLPVWGFLIECVLTCACRLFSRLLGEFHPRYDTIIDSFFCTTMVIIAFNYSGGYFNPVLATGLKWGCDGHSMTEHVLVYWGGSIIGSIISLRIWYQTSIKEKCIDLLRHKTKKEMKTE